MCVGLLPATHRRGILVIGFLVQTRLLIDVCSCEDQYAVRCMNMLGV